MMVRPLLVSSAFFLLINMFMLALLQHKHPLPLTELGDYAKCAYSKKLSFRGIIEDQPQTT
ncbi:MAG: hypothetical protein EBZ69_01750 [Alphaproteobacteria bacterium]|nr:hypothetical protein [Alphaproteobacteria bacterium]